MLTYVGRSVPRKEGTAKARGRAGFLDELRVAGMLLGRTVRGSVACGRLASVRLDLGGSGFTVAVWTELSGRNCVSDHGDQPFLAERAVAANLLRRFWQDTAPGPTP